MKIAFYKGPGKKFWHKAFHYGVCVVTQSKYSHVELLFGDGWSASASSRDGGVRFKKIDFDPARWDVVDLKSFGSEVAARTWFLVRLGQEYDRRGIVRFLWPWIGHSPNKWFCSEAVASALGFEETHTYSPQTLAKMCNLE